METFKNNESARESQREVVKDAQLDAETATVRR